jgi:hypothetical protein
VGFVALEVSRAGTTPQTSEEFVRRMWAFFAALSPGEFPPRVQLAPLLARSSTDDQFQFASAPSWPASTPNNNPSTRPDPVLPAAPANRRLLPSSPSASPVSPARTRRRSVAPIS